MPIDYKKYPPNWKSEIRPAILARANNCCEFCGIQNYTEIWIAKRGKNTSWHPSEAEAIEKVGYYSEIRRTGKKVSYPKPQKVILTIAHLDHDETNHDVRLDRLAALCQLCHLRYDAKEKFNRRNSKSHNDITTHG